MSKKIIQFGYNVRVPEGIPLVDCTVIPNPYKAVKSPSDMRRQVRNHPLFDVLVREAIDLLSRFDTQVIGIGCGYGVHRSGAVVEEVIKYQRRTGYLGEGELIIEKIGKE